MPWQPAFLSFAHWLTMWSDLHQEGVDPVSAAALRMVLQTSGNADGSADTRTTDSDLDKSCLVVPPCQLSVPRTSSRSQLAS